MDINAKTIKCETVWETNLSLPLVNRGKVRDIYSVGSDKLLIVTTDRLSAFDVVLPTPIPCKGKVLNQISLFWFEKFKNLIPDHVITGDLDRMGFDQDLLGKFGSILTGRSVLVHRAKPLPVECVVRGFLAGSGWKDYLKTGTIRRKHLIDQNKLVPENTELKLCVGDNDSASFSIFHALFVNL